MAKLKREKFINGHQVYLGGAWHNFCVKCGATPQHLSSAPCEQEGEYDSTKTIIHESKSGRCLCGQCNLLTDIFDTKHKVGKVIFIPYIEYRKDRLVERYYTGRYNLDCIAYHLIKCSISDDERNIKEIAC